MFPILFCSVAVVTIAIERAWVLRAGKVSPSELLGRVWHGVFLADDQPQLLRGALLEHAGERRDLPLAISADADATHQSVVHSMDVADQLGFAHLRIVTRALGTE